MTNQIVNKISYSYRLNDGNDNGTLSFHLISSKLSITKAINSIDGSYTKKIDRRFNH
jgi:hypothetical protein